MTIRQQAKRNRLVLVGFAMFLAVALVVLARGALFASSSAERSHTCCIPWCVASRRLCPGGSVGRAKQDSRHRRGSGGGGPHSTAGVQGSR